MSLHLRPEGAETVARHEAVQAQDVNFHAFALMRLIAADMEREANANRADSGTVETWAGMLQWLVSTLDERNDELRESYLAAEWLRQPRQAGAA